MPKQKEEHIGSKLLAAIKAKGVNQADVARHFKVAPATVSSDWIKFGRIAKKHIPELVDYFGLPYQYWLGAKTGEEGEPRSTENHFFKESSPEQVIQLRIHPRKEGSPRAKLHALLDQVPDYALSDAEKRITGLLKLIADAQADVPNKKK